MKRLKIYVAHPIRGNSGNPKAMEVNIAHAKRLQKWLDMNFPDVDWYVPGAHDDFASEAWGKELTTEQILEIDKRILAKCDAMVAMFWEDSRGVDGEIQKTMELNMPMQEYAAWYPDKDSIVEFLQELYMLKA